MNLEALRAGIVACERCPRLRAYCRLVAEQKKREFSGWNYWGRPVSGFGDPQARLLVVGLAPAAHGGNRTGRVFTGDSSGDWLYEALHCFGFANQPLSVSRDDGLRLRDCYVTAAARCAPPGNRPTRGELEQCRGWLARELALLHRIRVVIALGWIAREAGSARRDGGIASRRGNDPLSAMARLPPCRTVPSSSPATIPAGRTPTPGGSRGRCGIGHFARRGAT